MKMKTRSTRMQSNATAVDALHVDRMYSASIHVREGDMASRGTRLTTGWKGSSVVRPVKVR